jgi:CHAT domain
VLDEVIATGGERGDWVNAIGGHLAVLDSERSSIACRGRVGSRISQMLPVPYDPDAQRSWAHFARDELGKLRVAAQRHLMLGATELTDEIDGVTRAFLAEVAEIWPLGSLTDCLTPDTDVVFQLEDALQQVPIAHYPCKAGGVPLYSLVRSTRVSLSLLVTIMQSRAERRFATDEHRMLALSYFAREDSAGLSVQLLHYGHRWLARKSPGGQFTCLNAAVIPPGSIGTLQAALRSGQGFQTVTVCGHGFAGEDPSDPATRDAAAPWGIRLQDGWWSGAGCDLSSVNLLLLPSCSMGRLRQAGDGDVEGMCALLALHRARSVLACRWPVLTDQAIAFTHEVVASYLALSARAEERERGSLRARAVNIARHRFLDGADAPDTRPALLLNTVAAFELFGLG